MGLVNDLLNAISIRSMTKLCCTDVGTHFKKERRDQHDEAKEELCGIEVADASILPNAPGVV